MNHSKGGDLSTILMDVFPTTSTAYIQLAINNAYCPIATRALSVNPLLDAEGLDDQSSNGALNHYSFDRVAFYAAFDEIRGELSRSEYKAFYYAYYAWQHENSRDWWVDEKWREGIREALCKVKPSN